MRKKIENLVYVLLGLFLIMRILHGPDAIDFVFIAILSILLLLTWRIGGKSDPAK